MVLSFLSIILALFTGPVQPQNFYSSYPSARKASAEAKKDLLVYFSSKTCATCESAWSAYIKDMPSTQTYISTRMDIEDFDGGVCFDLYELKQVPAWVIVSSSSEIKDKWTGGWKDAAGNPTMFDQSVKPGEQNIESKPVSYSVPKNVEVKTSISQAATPKDNPSIQPKESPSENRNQTFSPITSSPMNSGWIIQAGYFGSEGNAQKLIGDLKSKGFVNFGIQIEMKDGNKFYRVVSKVYPSETEVNAEQQHMLNKGIKTSVKKS
ncbi:MAG: SPOR domain-containing protein [Saprospiraceae bacterium]